MNGDQEHESRQRQSLRLPLRILQCRNGWWLRRLVLDNHKPWFKVVSNRFICNKYPELLLHFDTLNDMLETLIWHLHRVECLIWNVHLISTFRTLTFGQYLHSTIFNIYLNAPHQSISPHPRCFFSLSLLMPIEIYYHFQPLVWNLNVLIHHFPGEKGRRQFQIRSPHISEAKR